VILKALTRNHKASDSFAIEGVCIEEIARWQRLAITNDNGIVGEGEEEVGKASLSL